MKQIVIAVLLLFQALFLCGVKKVQFEVCAEGDKASLKRIQKDVQERKKHSHGYLIAMGTMLLKAEKTKDPYEKQKLVSMYFCAQSQLGAITSQQSIIKLKKFTQRMLKLIESNCYCVQDEIPSEDAKVYSGDGMVDENDDVEERMVKKGTWVWKVPDEDVCAALFSELTEKRDNHLMPNAEEQGALKVDEDGLTFAECQNLMSFDELYNYPFT